MEKPERTYRVVSFLKRQELDLLDEVVKDIYFSYGIKIPRERLIEEIIKMFKTECNHNKEAIEKELVERFKKPRITLERREFHRIPANLQLGFRVLESLQPLTQTETHNVSALGIQVVLPECFEPETRLELSIKTPDKEVPVIAYGRVVWVKKDSSKKGYITGIQLVHIEKKDKEGFYKYVLGIKEKEVKTGKE